MLYICEMIDICNKANRHCEHQYPHKWGISELGEMCALAKCSNIQGKCKCKSINDEEAMVYLL